MTKFEIKYTSSFKSDLKKFKKDTKALSEIKSIIKRLANDEILEDKYRDHGLIGDYIGMRECHIKPDLLLIYQKHQDTLILSCIRVGSHSQLF